MGILEELPVLEYGHSQYDQYMTHKFLVGIIDSNHCSDHEAELFVSAVW